MQFFSPKMSREILGKTTQNRKDMFCQLIHLQAKNKESGLECCIIFYDTSRNYIPNSSSREKLNFFVKSI